MTLNYESELLFDLMKRGGDNTPSDVLPYESEFANIVEGINNNESKTNFTY